MPADNEAERAEWNHPARVEAWYLREPMTRPVTAHLVDHLAPQAGERIVDIGCGTGPSTWAIADRMGSGTVLGIDLSVPFVERAAAGGAVKGVSFVVADAQEDDFPGAPFDAATSKFGVMFFADTVAAFANIRRQVRSGGRLVFACWRGPADNPWNLKGALEGFVRPDPSPPPGPFTLADVAATTAQLEQAGWREVSCHPVDLVSTVEQESLLVGRFDAVAEEDRPAAREAALAHLQPLARRDGRYDAPLGVQIFQATNP